MINISMGNVNKTLLSGDPEVEMKTTIDYIDPTHGAGTFTCPNGYEVMVSVYNNGTYSRIEVYKNGQPDGLRIDIDANSKSQRIDLEKRAMGYVALFINHKELGILP